MVKFNGDIRKEQLHILSLLFEINEDVDNEYEAQNLIYNKLKEAKEENNLDNFSIQLFIKDDTKQKWKQGISDPNLFVKIFFNEIEYVKKIFNVTRAEALFLYSLSGYLLWEENLLVDKNGLPLNQKGLIKELGLNRKTIYKNMKSLEIKKCVIRIWNGKECYYIVNPYLLFFGEKINKNLYKLFKLIGYIPLKDYKNNKKEL